ncbi:cell wall hydrolase [Clostridium sp. YIM B02515]|uniref:Cell wall hydrolase n=1 Tax=Clostridium rhizosphaerae TaxID=2803861 RepID=A0ABS1T9H3_9CLOT|nr:cell wall hydrolase [Clostridium rhizosphaerae]MBL4935407.1 cell wall hydrolase [Clostridium rhizosphaerae]
MKMDKKTRLILAVTLITAAGALTAMTYGIQKGKHTSKINLYTYSINDDALKNEAVEMTNSIRTSESYTTANNDQSDKLVVIKDEVKNIENKDKEYSRGGTGLSEAKPKTAAQQKPQVKTPLKQQTKVQSKPASNSTAASVAAAGDEKDLFARLVSAESAGESFEGQLAVATVIMNRVKSPNYSNSITGVIMDKSWGYQFTPVLDGRINQPATASAKKAVDMVLSGYRSFGTEIMFFINPKKAESTYVVKNKTYFKSIGNHDFYY